MESFPINHYIVIGRKIHIARDNMVRKISKNCVLSLNFES